jgi:hypothetical protein
MNRYLILLLLIISTSVYSKPKVPDTFELHAVTIYGEKLKWVFYRENQLFKNPTYPLLYKNLVIMSDGRWGVYDNKNGKMHFIKPINSH